MGDSEEISVACKQRAAPLGRELQVLLIGNPADHAGILRGEDIDAASTETVGDSAIDVLVGVKGDHFWRRFGA